MNEPTMKTSPMREVQELQDAVDQRVTQAQSALDAAERQGIDEVEGTDPQSLSTDQTGAARRFRAALLIDRGRRLGPTSPYEPFD